jgi:hypothetical protein
VRLDSLEGKLEDVLNMLISTSHKEVAGKKKKQHKKFVEQHGGVVRAPIEYVGVWHVHVFVVIVWCNCVRLVEVIVGGGW